MRDVLKECISSIYTLFTFYSFLRVVDQYRLNFDSQWHPNNNCEHIVNIALPMKRFYARADKGFLPASFYCPRSWCFSGAVQCTPWKGGICRSVPVITIVGAKSCHSCKHRAIKLGGRRLWVKRQEKCQTVTGAPKNSPNPPRHPCPTGKFGNWRAHV